MGRKKEREVSSKTGVDRKEGKYKHSAPGGEGPLVASELSGVHPRHSLKPRTTLTITVTSFSLCSGVSVRDMSTEATCNWTVCLET